MDAQGMNVATEASAGRIVALELLRLAYSLSDISDDRNLAYKFELLR